MKDINNNIHETIKKEIFSIKEEFYNILAEIIKIPSEKGEPLENAPFGKYPKLALEKIVEIGTKMGFSGEVVNNAAAYLQYGEGDEYIGIFGHLDIVPAGDNWNSDPFELVLKDEKFFARGILDNKGPIVANLFGLYILKKLNIKPNKPIRIVFGSDEESGSNDIPMYLEKEKPPLFGYTPDCKYPVVYGERGILKLKLSTNFNEENINFIDEIKGDFNSSYIPDKLEIKLKNKEILEFSGKKAPSNAPEMGENAIIELAKYLIKQDDLNKELKEYFNWIYNGFNKYEGENLGIGFKDKDSGKTQVSLTSIEKNNNKLEIEFSTRYPVTVTEEEMITGLEKNIPLNSKLEVVKSMQSTLFNKNDERLEILTKAYKISTEFDPTPVTTTGATYARSVPNIVAFGPSFPGQKGIAHKENEYMDEKDLLKNLEIYTMAIYYLATEYK